MGNAGQFFITFVKDQISGHGLKLKRRDFTSIASSQKSQRPTVQGAAKREWEWASEV